MPGALLGRQNICWRKPPLLWWKTLGVLLVRKEGIRLADTEVLDKRTAELFPKVTALLGPRLTKKDVVAACKEQEREYSLHRFLGRVDAAIRWDEKLADVPIQAAYREVVRRRRKGRRVLSKNGAGSR